MKRITRLQGQDWYNLKKNNKLTLLCISVSSNNNYCCFVRCDNKVYKHWLHPIEAEKLEKSQWFKEHIIYHSDELYRLGQIKDIAKGVSFYEGDGV